MAKTPFPDALMPFLADKVTTLATGNLTWLIESLYQDLKAHKVKKVSIEAKVREVVEKCPEKKIWVVKNDVLVRKQSPMKMSLANQLNFLQNSIGRPSVSTAIIDVFDSLETSRRLEVARASSTRPPSLPTEEQHAQFLNDSDAAKLSLAKAINDAEGILASKEARLTALMAECSELEASDPASEHDLDSTPCVISFSLPKGTDFSER